MSAGLRTSTRIRNALISRRSQTEYQPTYRETNYQRSVVKRLTPLSWFLVLIMSLGVTSIAMLLVIRSLEAQSRDHTVVLAQRLRPEATLEPVLVWVETPVTPPAEFRRTPTPDTRPTRAPTPTPDPNIAPWVKRLTQQPDGTLMAPQAVVAQAITDLSTYYAMQRDLTIEDFLARRDEILNTYFTGAALDEMRQMEASRDIYAMNRAGRFSIEVRAFTPDGLTARAAVITRDWVSDLYDIASRQLVAQGRLKPNTLSIMTIRYDTLAQHWKIATVDEVIELDETQP